MADNASVLRRVKLSDCATFQEGYVNPPQGVPEYFGDEVKWLRAVDLNNSFVWETSRRLSRAGFESAGKASLLFEPDTLAISKSGTIGRLGILKDYMCGNRAVINIKVDRARCDNRFIFYSLQIRRNEIEELATGSVQRNLYCSVLGDLEIAIPPLAEQKAIASILGALDDKIELNRRMNATLEGMARALFQSWFVDFDPVRAKLDGRKPEGMDKATAALFPDAFEDSSIGPVPKGWMKTSLGEEVEFQTGFSFQSEFFTETPPGIRLARGMNVKEGEFFWGNQSRFWPQVTPDVEQYQLSVGDILIGMDGSKVGKNWVRVRSADLPCLLVQRVARLREADSIGQNIIALLIGSPRFRDFVESVKTGTTIPHISGGQIKGYSFLRPPHDDNRIFRRFESLIAPLTAQADKNHAEAETLATLRDTLLPKLLSGELSVASSKVKA